MTMVDADRIKAAVADAIDRVLAESGTGTGTRTGENENENEKHATPGTQKLLERIVLSDILGDDILAARPNDRTFPLRLFFGELGTLLAKDDAVADHAFTLASGLNFFFRAEMDGEAKVRVAMEVSRQLYEVAHEAKLDPELVAKAAPLVAALMSTELERVKLESVDHVKVFDSQIHERTAASDPTGSRIVRPASFLCRVTTNNAVKAKAQVVT
jgi:hypothetical protein